MLNLKLKIMTKEKENNTDKKEVTTENGNTENKENKYILLYKDKSTLNVNIVNRIFTTEESAYSYRKTRIDSDIIEVIQVQITNPNILQQKKEGS